MSKIVFSVCIPTYNRLDKLKSLISSFLASNSHNINLVITDNFSTDGTDLYFKNNHFFNVIYKRNNYNIGGTTNVVKALLNAEGKYAVLCLDKDAILFSNLSAAVKHFINNTEVVFGKFKRSETNAEGEILITEKGLPSLLQNGFLSEHPTGIFFSSSHLKKLSIVHQILKENKKFPFYVDILTGYFSTQGCFALANYNVVETEKLQKIKSSGSLTYSRKDVYFLPRKRVETFFTYLFHLGKLSLTTAEKKTIEQKLLRTLIQDVTINLTSIYNDKFICNHYGLTTRKYHSLDYLINTTKFYIYYYVSTTNLSKKEKLFSYLRLIKRILKGFKFNK